MKKFWLVISFVAYLLILGCGVSSTVNVKTETIAITTLSEVSKTLSAGDEITVFFGFTASEGITQENVNIVIKNSADLDVTDLFDVEVSAFSESSSTVASKNCSFTISVDPLCYNDAYMVYLELSLGVKKDIRPFGLFVGTAPTVTIDSIDSKTLVSGSTKKDTIEAKILKGTFLTTDCFDIVVDGSSGKPTVGVISFDGETVLLEASAPSAPIGLYSATLSIPSLSISKGFTISVVEADPVQIISIENIALAKGSKATTRAVVANGEKLSTSDFSIVVSGTGSSSSTTVSPTAKVTTFQNDTAIITVDASTADLGTYTATLSVDESEKDFIITVTEEDFTFVEISASQSSITIVKGTSESVNLTIEASSILTNSAITYSVVNAFDNASSDAISLSIPTFSAKSQTVTATLSVDADSVGSFYVRIYAENGSKKDSVSITVSAVHNSPTIDSVYSVWVDQGKLKEARADISSNGYILKNKDFTVTVAEKDNATAPVARISAYSNGTLSFIIDATAATAGEFTGTVTLAKDTVDFTITVKSIAFPLTENKLTLYNPYAKDGYNSAYNLISGNPVAGFLASNGKMDYASSDSTQADIAVDNSMDIRLTTIVTELTSLNGALFKASGLSSSDYYNATDVSLKAICNDSNFGSDNEVLAFDEGDVFAMKLGGRRGFVIFKVTSIDILDESGSSSNTGSIGIAYKFCSL